MKYRSYQKELLDDEHVPFRDILSTMSELNVINTFLGGHAITCKGIDYFLNKSAANRPVVIAEIGCGGGDNLSAIQKYLNKKGIAVSLIGVDLKQECIQFAAQKSTTEITWICSDYRQVVWPGAKPDIIFSSLFCHHFTNEQLATQLQWLKENSRMGFFINDLHRHPVAYYSIRLLTTVFSKSVLVKNDGPLSVRRAFIKNDWIKLLTAAGIKKYSIKWQWAFRYLICASNEQQ